MSDYVDRFDWGFDLEEDVEKIDWTAVHEDIMNGPFGVAWEDVPGAADELQPGDR